MEAFNKLLIRTYPVALVEHYWGLNRKASSYFNVDLHTKYDYNTGLDTIHGSRHVEYSSKITIGRLACVYLLVCSTCVESQVQVRIHVLNNVEDHIVPVSCTHRCVCKVPSMGSHLYSYMLFDLGMKKTYLSNCDFLPLCSQYEFAPMRTTLLHTNTAILRWRNQLLEQDIYCL